ncbi:MULTISPECIES: hypothetical protein [unclassified Sphingomonas]|uniref:hypothetical protein n=1 Tax=unclassified Sphingomonas TaxID=196159 RepID=UPI0006F868A2|nr:MULTISPECIES: hypothetical protein [unclassified Sphingomonas]KQM61903.1 hypothetical protein ASE65_06825 [Sphingomonas sp. Leaf16]KQN13176.1 hypothetical protein ASE81_07840 [Sphingomonas sp. Leaf29]KQN20061.1 hypothetical protein ASE83_07765 [Sphingomonas sp. Leaf32]
MVHHSTPTFLKDLRDNSGVVWAHPHRAVWNTARADLLDLGRVLIARADAFDAADQKEPPLPGRR